MKKLSKIAMYVLIVMGIINFQACQKEELETEPLSSSEQSGLELKSRTLNTFYSSTVPLGAGVARAWITVSKNGDPVAVGVNLSEKALLNLPGHMQNHVLMLPTNKGNNFYTHVLLDWNPAGHEPPGIYDTPHFDFHFYIIPNEDRLEIPFLADDFMDTTPEAEYIPESYIQLPGIVPAMGAHWANFNSPELNGGTFTQTFLWGSYDGEFIFWEPMITLDYLLTNPDVTFPIPQPDKYKRDGWYPASYKIKYSPVPGTYTIAITDLIYHEAE